VHNVFTILVTHIMKNDPKNGKFFHGEHSFENTHI